MSLSTKGGVLLYDPFGLFACCDLTVCFCHCGQFFVEIALCARKDIEYGVIADDIQMQRCIRRKGGCPAFSRKIF